MWQEKLQDAATSHPWLEPHEAIKRKTQAPGMQLVDWYGFTVPKTKKEMFLKQSARREDLLVVGEVDNIHSFFSDYETEWRISYSMISTRRCATARTSVPVSSPISSCIRGSSCTKSRDLKPCRVAASPDGAIYSMRLTATWNMPTSSFSIAKPVIATAWTRADAQGKT